MHAWRPCAHRTWLRRLLALVEALLTGGFVAAMEALPRQVPRLKPPGRFLCSRCGRRTRQRSGPEAGARRGGERGRGRGSSGPARFASTARAAAAAGAAERGRASERVNSQCLVGAAARAGRVRDQVGRRTLARSRSPVAASASGSARPTAQRSCPSGRAPPPRRGTGSQVRPNVARSPLILGTNARAQRSSGR